MKCFEIRRDVDGRPTSLTWDNFDVLHVVGSKRSMQFIDRIVEILNKHPGGYDVLLDGDVGYAMLQEEMESRARGQAKGGD